MSVVDEIYEGLIELHKIVDQRQLDAGYPVVFHEGDLIRVPLGVSWNAERDYKVVRRFANGISTRNVEDDGSDGKFVQAFLDEAVIRLGVCHSPNHVPRGCQ